MFLEGLEGLRGVVAKLHITCIKCSKEYWLIGLLSRIHTLGQTELGHFVRNDSR